VFTHTYNVAQSNGSSESVHIKHTTAPMYIEICRKTTENSIIIKAWWLLFRTQDPTAQQCIKHSGKAHAPNCERHAPVLTPPDVTMQRPSLRCRNRNN